VIDDGRTQDTQDDRNWLFESRRKDEGKKLRLVAEFCKGNNTSRYETASIGYPRLVTNE
jgi:hypothetical protein